MDAANVTEDHLREFLSMSCQIRVFGIIVLTNTIAGCMFPEIIEDGEVMYLSQYSVPTFWGPCFLAH